MNQITGKTRIFAVIADPIDHVRAPAVFNPLFAERQINAVMIPLRIAADDLEVALPALARMANVGGVAVTIPHKTAAARLCHELDPVAAATNAVNVIRFTDGGHMHGANFDGLGFTAGLKSEGHDCRNTHALIMGAGGAAKAIALALAEEGIASLAIGNRSIEKAQQIADLIHQHYPSMPVKTAALEDARKLAENADIIINATSLGLQPEDPLPIDLKGLETNTIIADIIMEPEKTAWLDQAGMLGMKTHRGRHMLDQQREYIAQFIGAGNNGKDQ